MEFKDIIQFVEEHKKEYLTKMLTINEIKLAIKHLEKAQDINGMDYGVQQTILNLEEMIDILES